MSAMGAFVILWMKSMWQDMLIVLNYGMYAPLRLSWSFTLWKQWLSMTIAAVWPIHNLEVTRLNISSGTRHTHSLRPSETCWDHIQ
jgi:hypothetical protein